MSLPDCAILTATRNRRAILANTIQQLQQLGLQSLPLWIYDDASDDRQAALDAVSAWPSAQVVRGESRVGQAKGRNVLLRACQCEYAIMLDDDQYFLSLTSIEAIGRQLAQRAAGSQFAVLAFQSVNKADGVLGTPKNVPAGPASSFMGGACLFHVPSVLRVGGYREFFVYGYEEPELAMRLWLNGLQVQYDPAIVVEHNHQVSSAACRNVPEYDRLYARNGILLDSLNMPLWFGLPLGVLRSARYCLQHKRNPAAKLRGIMEGIGGTFRYWKSRKSGSLRQYLEWRRFCRGRR